MTFKEKFKYYRFEVGLMLATSAVIIFGAVWATNSTNNITKSTVMITRPDGRSGGTGVILKSYDSNSVILTNSHVCEVVLNGGIVTTTTGESHAVIAYKRSNVHDLCMVVVSANLKTQTKLAPSAPVSYEHAYVSGHPHLYPNVVTEGHFSGNRIIEVYMGVRDCSEDDLKDPTSDLLCGLLGNLPIIKRFETVLVTATIMPGSSGSGVYNSKKELSGLVFAGSGDLGYAFTVPFDYVANFVNYEAQTLEYSKPSNQLSIKDLGSSSKSFDQERINIITLCNTSRVLEVQKVCDIIKHNTLE